MAVVSLSLIGRSDYGYARTSCACAGCSISCRYVPGQLSPLDLGRLVPRQDGMIDLRWAAEHLRASPGAVVRCGTKTRRIRTIVPARKPGTFACHWLQDDGRCQVHGDAPWGCACFDSHQLPDEAKERSARVLAEIDRDFSAQGEYARLWNFLNANNLVAPPVEEARAALEREIGSPYPIHRPVS